jgi:uncharacterized protein DUF4185
MGTADGNPANIPLLNDGFGTVEASDLGAITRYHNSWYLAFGDTRYVSDPPWGGGTNFLVATAPATRDLASGIRFNGYLNMQQTDFGPAPYRAVTPDADYVLPSSLFTLTWQGKQYMIGQYMVNGNAGGFLHWSEDSRIALYDDATHMFRAYKPAAYDWRRRDATASDANPIEYNFGQCSFWEDAAAGYLYMMGAPSSRFGGVKLARIAIPAFLDPANVQGWEYYLGGNRWSAPTVDEGAIDAQVAWLIAPRDPGFSLDKDYGPIMHTAGSNWCADITIAEFSVVWDPYLKSFLLLTGSVDCAPNGLKVYTAPSISGPWTQTAQDIAMPFASTPEDKWDYYAPYTSSDMLRDNGRTVYFVMSTYTHYGVYLYKADLSLVARD